MAELVLTAVFAVLMLNLVAAAAAAVKQSASWLLAVLLAGTTGAAAAAVLYAVHHGLAKGALFLGVPVLQHYGRGPTGLLVLAGMAGAALAVAGAPLSSGAYGKYVSKEAVSGVEVMGVGLDQLLPLVATGSTVLLMRFGFLLRQAEREPRRSLDGELLSWVGVCAAGVILPWLIGAWWIPGAGEFSWTASALWDAIWPLLLGLAAGAAVWAAAAAGKLPVWLRADGTSVQPGDLVVAEESAVLRAGRTGIRAADVTHRQLGRWGEGLGGAAADAAEGARRITAAVERRLVQWRASGAVILVLLTGAVVVLAWGWLW